MTSGRETPGLIGSAIQDWYSEKSGYNFVTGSCSGVQCAATIYTQVSQRGMLQLVHILSLIHCRLCGDKAIWSAAAVDIQADAMDY